MFKQLIALTLLLAIAFAQVTCPSGFQQCNNLCFNPQIQNCLNGNVVSIGQPGTVNTNTGGSGAAPGGPTPPAGPGGAAQCASPFQPCGNLCFNPQIQNCLNGAVVSIGQPGTVNTNTGGNGGAPGGPTPPAGPGGAAQCPGGFLACGNLCFNPQIQKYVLQNNFIFILSVAASTELL